MRFYLLGLGLLCALTFGVQLAFGQEIGDPPAPPGVTAHEWKYDLQQADNFVACEKRHVMGLDNGLLPIEDLAIDAAGSCIDVIKFNWDCDEHCKTNVVQFGAKKMIPWIKAWRSLNGYY